MKYMTVSELIDELEDLNGELEVYIDDEDERTPLTYVSTGTITFESGDDSRVAVLNYIDPI
jgi:hypothetical protein